MHTRPSLEWFPKFWMIFAAITTLMAAQAAIFAPRSAMGQDVSNLTLELLWIYPGAIISQLLKITFFMSTITFISFYQQKTKRHIFHSLICWALISIGAILQYPAIFEDSLPTRVTLAISQLPRSLFTPTWIHNSGWILWLGPAFYTFCKRHPKYLLIISTLITQQDSRNWTPKPKIFLISIDSLRADAVTPATTPHIHTTQKQSTSFHRHFVGIPRTFPSWVETLEGRPAALSKVRHMFPTLTERQYQGQHQTFVKQLSEHGIHTSIISDFAGDIFPRFQTHFHQTTTPTFTLPSMLQLNLTTHFRFFLPYILLDPFRNFFPEIEASPIATTPQRLINRAKQLSDNTSNHQLITIFFSTAHFPYATPWPDYPSAPNDVRFHFQKNPDLSYTALTQAEKNYTRTLYESALHSIDTALGDLFSHLKNQNIWDQSTIIITADHGEEIFDTGRIQGHGEHLWGDTMLRVPLIWKSPQQQNPLNIKSITRSIDLGSTLLGQLHTLQFRDIHPPSNPSILGQDLSPWLTDPQQKAFPTLQAFAETGLWFSNQGDAPFQKKRLWYPNINELITTDPIKGQEVVLHHDYKNIAITAKHRALITGDYKILYLPTESGIEWELYNHIQDPQNTKNIAAQKPNILRKLQHEMIAYLKEIERESQMTNQFVVPL